MRTARTCALAGALIIASCAALGGGGAGVFLTPEHHGGESGGSRGEIPDKSLAFMQTGVTTRADVMLALGEPDIATNNDTWFAYRWVMMTGGWFFVVPAAAPVGGGSAFHKTHALLIEFDAQGVVQRFETRVEKFAGDLTYADLTHW